MERFYEWHASFYEEIEAFIRSLRDTLALLTGSCRCRVSCMCMAVLDVNKSKRGCGSVPVVYLNIMLLT